MPFHFNSTGLDVGSIILPGNWGRIIINAGQAHNSYKRENDWEAVRTNNFADKPSRLRSAFYFVDKDEALLYGKKDATWRAMMILYEVELLEPDAPQHIGDANLIMVNYAATTIAQYWKGSMSANPNKETLSESRLKILRRLSY